MPCYKYSKLLFVLVDKKIILMFQYIRRFCIFHSGFFFVAL